MLSRPIKVVLAGAAANAQGVGPLFQQSSRLCLLDFTFFNVLTKPSSLSYNWYGYEATESVEQLSHMIQHNKQRLNELLEIKESRLHELEKQKALQGINTPPHINLEIEDIKRDIRIMRDALDTGILSTKENTIDLPSKLRSSNNSNQYPWRNRLLWAIPIIGALVLGTFLGRLINNASPQSNNPNLTNSYESGRQTAIAELQQTSTTTSHYTSLPPENDIILPFSGLNISASTYEDKNLPKGNYHLIVNSTPRNEYTSDTYKFDYNISESAEVAAVGINLQFPSPIDIADYKSLKFSITFGDYKSACAIAIFGTKNKYFNSQLGKGIYNIFSIPTEQNVEIPVSDIINQTSDNLIYLVEIYTTSELSNGEHSFIIKNLRFVK